MKHFPRRRSCASMVLALLSASVAAYAQTAPSETIPSKTTASEASADLPTETLHANGVRMLKEGRTFEKAAEMFRLAAQKEPMDFSHQLGLGCALASRAASLPHAAVLTLRRDSTQDSYSHRLSDWEAYRAIGRARYPKTFNAATLDLTKPQPPPAAYLTEDDQAPFTLTFKEAGIRIAALSAEARAAWEKALTLAKTPSEKAEVLYVRGWGRRLLEQYDLPFSGRPDDDTPPPELSTPEGREAALQSVEQAAALVPDNAVYWQAVGDLAWADGLTGRPDIAIDAFEKSVRLAPESVNVLYYLYQNATKTMLRPQPAQNYLVFAMNDLHRAQARDKTNAWPLYQEALFSGIALYSGTIPTADHSATPKQKQAALAAVQNSAARTRGKKAIDLIVAGNALERDEAPRYEESVPPLLAHAWNYNAPMHQGGLRESALEVIIYQQGLARSVMAYAQVMAGPEKNVPEALRASHALIGMGKRMISENPDKNDPRLAETTLKSQIGIDTASTGYKTLIQTLKQAGKTAEAEAAQKEGDAFSQESKKYRVDLNALIAFGISPSTASPVTPTTPTNPSVPVPISVPQPVQPNGEGGVVSINLKDGAEMVRIPAGPFLMGDDDQSDNKRHTVTLSAYSIYKKLVTVGMYEKFCKETGHKMPAPPQINTGWGKKDYPIVNVGWDDAKAYCDWAGMGLPSEAQWEKAARGTDGRKYPWGNVFDTSKLWGSGAEVTHPDFSVSVESLPPGVVGSFPSGASPYGVLDMASNVWQWCADWYDEGFPVSRLGRLPDPVNTSVGEKKRRSVRGGDWNNGSDAEAFRCANRSAATPGKSGIFKTAGSDDGGFRCVFPK